MINLNIGKIAVAWAKKVAWQRCLPNNKSQLHPLLYLTNGSYGLGVGLCCRLKCRLLIVHDPKSDIDALCVGPFFATIAEDFFIVLRNILESRPEIPDIHCVKDSKLPLMQLKFDGISVDIPYAQPKVLNVPKLEEFVWSTCANQRILLLVPNLKVDIHTRTSTIDLFSMTLVHVSTLTHQFPAVAASASLFTGGYAMIYPWFMKFEFLAIFLLQVMTISCTNALVLGDLLAIDLEIFQIAVIRDSSFFDDPYEHCNSNVTKSTFNKIRAEFLRGHAMTRLEAVQGFSDPNPMEYVDMDVSEPNVVFYWGLNRSRSNFVCIEPFGEDFSRSVYCGYYGIGGKMELSIVQASELPKNARFFSGNGKKLKACWKMLDYNQRRTPAYSLNLPSYFVGSVESNGDTVYPSAGV
ncbi:hypothetical protein SADUNF_Sadunf08G0082000 [Salix dunnii]|uniref:Poly(A) polymerase nucleotidyltransferase domain-containing protein n=1 Tax=Salix dunnii TaxID=1413687 RepID=A0A835K1Q6_9ROSI|nr:hypothetical protein SADUNF_Sadunf08G0082000 [Salix dunnii]